MNITTLNMYGMYYPRNSNLLTLAKWLPPSIVEYEATFTKCRNLKVDCFMLIVELTNIAESVRKIQHGKSAHSGASDEQNLPMKDMEIICNSVNNIVDNFSECFVALQVTKVHTALARKFKLFKQILRKAKMQLCYILQEFICDISYLFVFYGEDILKLTLRFSNAYNSLLEMDSKYNLLNNSNCICNNSCPYLFYPMRKFSITRLLQILSYHRAEYCSHKLIDCLLETYKMHEESDDDNSSDNSSVEIYMALTKHLSPPVEIASQSTKKEKERSNVDDSIGSFVDIDEMISHEEANVLSLLNSTQQVAPTMLGKDGIKKMKDGGTKISSKVTEKALEYYEQILWAEVGNYLEHVILWWACSPLSARPPRSSQHLREWINNFVPTADVPPVILSALTSLADALGVHVTLTLWDQCFRQALVASKKSGNPETGQLFCNVLQELVVLSNLCEVTPDWIIGAPLDELPLVEQIPVLHRLDHSIHTARLWATNECRKIANNWNVRAFFIITHRDIVNCLTQLNDLRLTDHTMEIEKGGMAVHVQVCALMRAKLVSEVKVNIEKLKEAPNDCISCLASICKIINLANLQMIFPPKNLWRINREDVPDSASPYVKKYLDRMLSPVLKSIDNDVICNMILTLICESWLDHIYNNKIKFSHWGAFQLLCDFAYVSVWIRECPYVTEQMRKKLLKNEVLRRCEGVGRLLLRCPGERLKMVDKLTKKSDESSEDDSRHQQMPAEMYVPNQEQWLELRALRKAKFYPLCC